MAHYDKYTASDWAIIFYDLDTKSFDFKKGFKSGYKKLLPIINDIDKYIKTCADNKDFENTAHKLKFTEKHKDGILNIFNTHRELITTHDTNIYFMEYGYWLSPLVCRYFNEYYNTKIESRFITDRVYVRRKCTDCDRMMYSNIDSRTRLESAILGKSNLPFFDVEYLCENCENFKRENTAVQKFINEENLETMPYNDYLHTDHWKNLRKRKLKQSGYKCQICAETDFLNVHHNTYENRGCEKDEDLVVLCNGCHQIFHNANKI